VLDPNGGEEIDALTDYTIVWTSIDNVGVMATLVLLSTDGGATYPDTLASLADETSFLWTVPDIDETDCRIRVVCHDAESNEGADASDADFRIIPHDGEAPVVTVLDPNGGEQIVGGADQHVILWESDDNIAVTETHILLSTDGGASYPDTLASVDLDSAWTWDVPDMDEPDCRIKIVCRDAVGNEGSDESDADFAVVTATGVQGSGGVPAHLVLRQNRPNPFNPVTMIEFGLPTPQGVTLGVYTVKGRLIRTLAEGTYGAGHHTVVWQGTDARGNEVASGLYFCRLVTEEKVLTRKMLLLK
ncbi:MAG: FlgD immunoglobulin-like domain containing protein, partial [Candidatus Eisenbacteria bacterium]